MSRIYDMVEYAWIRLNWKDIEAFGFIKMCLVWEKKHTTGKDGLLFNESNMDYEPDSEI